MRVPRAPSCVPRTNLCVLAGVAQEGSGTIADQLHTAVSVAAHNQELVGKDWSLRHTCPHGDILPHNLPGRVPRGRESPEVSNRSGSCQRKQDRWRSVDLPGNGGVG